MRTARSGRDSLLGRLAGGLLGGLAGGEGLRLAGLDLDAAALSRLGDRHAHGQHAVVVPSGRLTEVDVVRQVERAGEAALRTFPEDHLAALDQRQPGAARNLFPPRQLSSRNLRGIMNA